MCFSRYAASRGLTGQAAVLLLGSSLLAQDPIVPEKTLEVLQTEYVAGKDSKSARIFHFGSQGPGDVFSNHTDHTNRLIPVYTFGKKADLGAFTGPRSVYRSAERLEALYGAVPPHTLNPEAEYADQSDLCRLQEQAAESGARQIILILFDGLDWPTTRAAAIARSGKNYSEGKGIGLNFLEEDAQGTAGFGYVVTSPTHAEAALDVDAQSVRFSSEVQRGGYDPRFAGPNPWTDGPLAHRGYQKGQAASTEEKKAIEALGGVLHAYTDSAASASEIATGIKTYNDSINVAPDGDFMPTVFSRLQERGWKVGAVTSVPFNHASPAAMYARNVHRDDYQDLGRDMLGLPNVATSHGAPRLPGLDVVIGAGWGKEATKRDLEAQGANAIAGNQYLTEADQNAIDADNGGDYVVASRKPGEPGSRGLQAAADRAAAEEKRLFGFYGFARSGHLPFRTADGGFDPAPGVRYPAEVYSPADLVENPTLAEMTRAALTVLGSKKDQRFALFIEPGDVDWALHDNNLDAAIGAVLSGCDAVQEVFDWVRKHSSWDDAVVIITADHGHYLVLDDPEALSGLARDRVKAP